MPFWSIARKDIRVILRDKSGAFMFFLLPIVFLFVFGAAFGGRSQGQDKSPFKILVSNADRGRHGAELLRAMQQMRLATTELAPDATDGAKRVEQQVGKGDYAIGVIVPPDFSAQLEAYVNTAAEGNAPPVPTQMRVLNDPAQPQAAAMANGAIFASVQRVMGPLYREAALARVPGAFRAMAEKSMAAQSGNSVMPFQMGSAAGNAQAGAAKGAAGNNKTDKAGAVKNEQITAGDIITPGFAVYFVFFLANSVAVSLLLERQEGTLRRMLSAPIARSQILLGKLVARGILGILQTILLFGVAGLFLHTHYGHSPLGIMVVALSTIFAATGLGLLIATFAKTPEQIQSTTTLLLLIMGAISGCLMPRMFLPDSVQKFSLITPHAWALNAYQDLMLRGRSLPEVLPDILAVVGFGAVFYALALMRFRFE